MIYSQQGVQVAPEVILGKNSISFNLYTTDNGESFIMNKHMLACFFDMPLRCAAKLLGMHRNSLTRLKSRLGVDKWPYVEVLRGNHFGFNKDEIVRSRESLMADMENEVELSEDSSVMYSLKVLRAAAEKAKLFWEMAGLGEEDEQVKQGNAKTGQVKKSSTQSATSDKLKPAGAVASVAKAVKEPELKDIGAVETTPVFWPLITEQFNFDPLFEVDGVEDELQLGPLEA
jgi:hypothetical protein